MLQNILLITEPDNYDHLENVVKRSWDSFFGSICTSAAISVSWLRSNACNFDLIIAALSDKKIEEFASQAFIVKKEADSNRIEVVQLNKEKVEKDELQKIIEEHLKKK